MFTSTLKLSCQERIVCQPTRLISECKKPWKHCRFFHIPPEGYNCNFSLGGTTPESREIIRHRPHSKVRYQAKIGIHFFNLQSATLWSCPLPRELFHHSRRNGTAPSPKCPRAPLLQADRDVIQPTFLPFLFISFCGSQLARRCSHTPRLFCLAPQTQPQWEVLKMLLLKLFSVLTLKRDEQSLINCRIYKIVLLYLLCVPKHWTKILCTEP